MHEFAQLSLEFLAKQLKLRLMLRKAKTLPVFRLKMPAVSSGPETSPCVQVVVRGSDRRVVQAGILCLRVRVG